MSLVGKRAPSRSEDRQRVNPPAKIVAVKGPDGSVLTLANLPPPGRTRWVAFRKAEVVVAVRGGLISVEEACRRYLLSPEELHNWMEIFVRYGVRGLRATHRPNLPRRRMRIRNPEENET